MSLTTGKRLSRHQWTEIPMTNAVISAVESMAEKEGPPLIKGGVPLFEWRQNTPVKDIPEEDVTPTDDDPDFLIKNLFSKFLATMMSTPSLPIILRINPTTMMLRMYPTNSVMMRPTMILLTMTTLRMTTKSMIPLNMSLTGSNLVPTTKTEP